MSLFAFDACVNFCLLSPSTGFFLFFVAQKGRPYFWYNRVYLQAYKKQNLVCFAPEGKKSWYASHHKNECLEMCICKHAKYFLNAFKFVHCDVCTMLHLHGQKFKHTSKQNSSRMSTVPPVTPVNIVSSLSTPSLSTPSLSIPAEATKKRNPKACKPQVKWRSSTGEWNTEILVETLRSMQDVLKLRDNWKPVHECYENVWSRCHP